MGPPHYQLGYKSSFVCTENPSQSLQGEFANGLNAPVQGFS